MSLRDVYVKTEKGLDEIQTRKAHLLPALRTVLVMVDGRSTAEAILAQVAQLGVPPDAFDQLLAQGFVSVEHSAPAPQSVAPAARGSAPPAEPLSENARFYTARQFMTETVVNAVGLKSFFFTLKLEKAETLQELRDLLPEYARILEKGSGHMEAEVMVQKAKDLIE